MNSPNNRKQKKEEELIKVKVLTPQSLWLGVPLLLLYLILGFITGSWRNSLVAEVAGSIRVLVLSLGIFLSFTGTLGFILYPEDRHRIVPKRWRKKSEELN